MRSAWLAVAGLAAVASACDPAFKDCDTNTDCDVLLDECVDGACVRKGSGGSSSSGGAGTSQQSSSAPGTSAPPSSGDTSSKEADSSSVEASSSAETSSSTAGESSSAQASSSSVEASSSGVLSSSSSSGASSSSGSSGHTSSSSAGSSSSSGQARSSSSSGAACTVSAAVTDGLNPVRYTLYAGEVRHPVKVELTHNCPGPVNVTGLALAFRDPSGQPVTQASATAGPTGTLAIPAEAASVQTFEVALDALATTDVKISATGTAAPEGTANAAPLQSTERTWIRKPATLTVERQFTPLDMAPPGYPEVPLRVVLRNRTPGSLTPTQVTFACNGPGTTAATNPVLPTIPPAQTGTVYGVAAVPSGQGGSAASFCPAVSVAADGTSYLVGLTQPVTIPVPALPVVSAVSVVAGNGGCPEVRYMLAQANNLPVQVRVGVTVDGVAARATPGPASNDPGSAFPSAGPAYVATTAVAQAHAFPWAATVDLPTTGTPSVSVTVSAGFLGRWSSGPPAAISAASWSSLRTGTCPVVAWPSGVNVAEPTDVQLTSLPDGKPAALVGRLASTGATSPAGSLLASLGGGSFSVPADGLAGNGAGVRVVRSNWNALASWNPEALLVTGPSAGGFGGPGLGTVTATTSGLTWGYQGLDSACSPVDAVAGNVLEPSSPLPELVVACADSRVCLFSRPDASHVAGTCTQLGAGGGSPLGRMALGDLDGDGRQDLVLATGSGTSFYLRKYLGNGQGGFAEDSAAMPAVSALASNLLLQDVDGNGTLDLVFTVGNRVAIHRNPGNGDFSGAAAFSDAAPTGTTLTGLAMARLRDGTAQDLVVVGKRGPSGVLRVYTDPLSGNGVAPLEPTGLGPLDALALGDLDGDGVLDVVVTNTLGNVVRPLRGNRAADGSWSVTP